jgi:hypothetical protein
MGNKGHQFAIERPSAFLSSILKSLHFFALATNRGFQPVAATNVQQQTYRGSRREYHAAAFFEFLEY